MNDIEFKLKKYFTKKYLIYRNKLIIKLVGKNTKVMINTFTTSDVFSYNNFDYLKGDIVVNNKIKTVSSRQSFVLDPSAKKQHAVY